MLTKADHKRAFKKTVMPLLKATVEKGLDAVVNFLMFTALLHGMKLVHLLPFDDKEILTITVIVVGVAFLVALDREKNDAKKLARLRQATGLPPSEDS